MGLALKQITRRSSLGVFWFRSARSTSFGKRPARGFLSAALSFMEEIMARYPEDFFGSWLFEGDSYGQRFYPKRWFYLYQERDVVASVIRKDHKRMSLGDLSLLLAVRLRVIVETVLYSSVGHNSKKRYTHLTICVTGCVTSCVTSCKFIPTLLTPHPSP